MKGKVKVKGNERVGGLWFVGLCQRPSKQSANIQSGRSGCHYRLRLSSSSVALKVCWERNGNVTRFPFPQDIWEKSTCAADSEYLIIYPKLGRFGTFVSWGSSLEFEQKG